MLEKEGDPMDEQLKKHGAISWFKLTTKDAPGAKMFTVSSSVGASKT